MCLVEAKGPQIQPIPGPGPPRPVVLGGVVTAYEEERPGFFKRMWNKIKYR